MGLNNSRPKRNRPRRSEYFQRSTEDIEYEVDDSRSYKPFGGTKAVNFQDGKWPKPDKERGDSDINLRVNGYSPTPVYATLSTYASSNPIYMNGKLMSINMGNRTRCVATSLGNEATEAGDNCMNGYEPCPPITNDNFYTEDHTTSCRFNQQNRSSLKLPPLPESAGVEKEKPPGEECQESATSCVQRPDSWLNSHDNQRVIDTVNPADISEINDGVARYGVVHKEGDVRSSYATVTPRMDRDCDATNRDETKKTVDDDYEPCSDEYNLRRTCSYKYGKFVMNEKPKKPPPSQHLPPQPAQPLPSPLPQTFQGAPPLSNDPTRDDHVHYRVGLGSELRVPRMTINVPGDLGSGLTNVDFRWSSHPNEFPVLSVDERHLTNVLHCLPHGSTFTSPVFVTLDLRANKGQIEVFYTPTDPGETPAWKKLRTVEADTGNARLTDDQEPFVNKALVSKNGLKVVLVLHHFSSFVVVENGSYVVRPRKAEVAIFLKTRITCQQSWSAILKVVVGCDRKNVTRRNKFLRDVGYRFVEQTELLLYNPESGSGVEVGIRDVEWMVGCMQKQSKTSMIHSLDCLWSGMEATSQFWMTSKGSRQNDEQLALTVFVRQVGRLVKPIAIYCDMNPNDLRILSKSRRTVSATRSSPALFASLKRPYESDATYPNSDSDLGLMTEDLSSHRRHDDVRSDSDQDFELNCCVNGKALTAEDLSDCKALSKRFSRFVDSTEKVCIYQHDPVPSRAIVKGRLEYSAEDVGRITSTVGGFVIPRSDLEWMLA